MYILFIKTTCFFIDYKSIGCYRDTADRAIATLEGADPILDESYKSRQNAIEKCAVAARKRGFHMFALQDSGWCAASDTAERLSTNMGKATIAKMTAKEVLGQTMFTSFKVSQCAQCISSNIRLSKKILA